MPLAIKTVKVSYIEFFRLSKNSERYITVLHPLLPLPRAGGGGVGSQHPSEVFRTQTKSRAKFNKNEKNPPVADFFLYLRPQDATSFAEGNIICTNCNIVRAPQSARNE